jgi:D-alanine-D-alanine ligase
MNILLLAGGTSSEREVSLRSGTAVREALEQSGHTVTTLDTANNVTDDQFHEYDAIFPVLHGTGGEDGALQTRLEALGIHSFVGSDATASELCFDKWRFRERMEQYGIPLADGDIITEGSVADHPLARAPFVLKPYNGGSSVDTFIVRDLTTADFTAMDSARERYGSMLIEQLIEGVEITVAVLGDEALPVIEIIPPSGGEFDYENKYNGASQELCPPLHVPEAAQKTARELAAHIHEICECRDYSRTDMFVTPSGALYVLETNTLPGMTDQSLVPKAALTAGISMPELCSRLATMAAERA